MATWSKVKFYYDTMLGSSGSTLTATSTESTGDYDADYIHNWLETNMWKAEDVGLADPQYITYDAGAGNTKQADYLAILGHNMNTAGATVTLQYSTDNFAADINDAFTGEAPSADTVYLKEFTDPGAKRYWRLKISGHGSTTPYMAVCVWGRKTELDYATASFDPYEQETKAKVGVSYGGYVTGIHTQYTERELRFRFDDSDAALYSKIKAWHDDHGLKNFFVAWESANNPADVWLMRPSTRFRNPFNRTGLMRDVTIQLTGRKE
ncbi:MAG: hypothetical protein V3W31_07930 [Thermodesulfobacteriota bacterium]